jgi:hypothetical protein
MQAENRPIKESKPAEATRQKGRLNPAARGTPQARAMRHTSLS